ncbi:MAG: hypothetical protein A2046_01260 [Bacteroidetes bacterium GWA2_30_7]|nr:MAG: hypothetical protein A2046_01260 [Bacteroidetes bacterium GWA2_30_7]
MKTLSFILLFIASAILLNYSCKKDDEKPIEENKDTTKVVNNQSSTKSSIVATSIYNDVITDVIVACDTNNTNKISCPTITFSSGLTYPKTLTIDFGTACIVNNHSYSGSVSASLTGKIRDLGTVVSISFTTFKVDTITVEGTVSLSVTDFNTLNTQVTFIDSIKNGKLTFPSGTISLNTNQTVKWTLYTVTDYTDDIFEISTGNTSATNMEGKTFTSEILDTVVIKASCMEPVDGKMKIISSDYNFPATIDFGDGTCDNKATVSTKVSVTVGNQTFEQDYSYIVTLP